jgi:uncharacterized membrane protein
MTDHASTSSLADLGDLKSLAEKVNTDEPTAWAPIIGGGALLLYGLTRRSLKGLLLASVGGLLLYRGLMPRPSTIRTGATTTINRSPEDLYSYWRKLENLPQAMDNIVSVQEINATRSRWVARTVGGATVEWEADIVRDEPNRLIAWRSDRDAEIYTAGVIRFEPAPGNRGTEVRLTLEYSLPFGLVGAVDAAMMGYEPSQQAGKDLQRFKQFMETGEVASTHGQPHGERGMAPAPESTAGFVNNVLEGLNIVRTGGRATRSRAGTRA